MLRILTILWIGLIPTTWGLASDVQRNLAELKILVFDSPQKAIERAEAMEKEVGGVQAGQVWLQIKALQALAMTKIEMVDEARNVATKALEQGAWIDDQHTKFSLQLTQIDAGSSLGLSEWEQLAPSFDQLLEAIETSGDDSILARAMTSYAAAASASGRPLLATGMMQKVLALLPRLPKDEYYYSILNDLVVTYQNVNEGADLGTILALAEEVRGFLKTELRRFLGAEIMYNLGFAYMSSENLPKALETMQEALHFGEALGNSTVMAYGWLGMGMIQTQAEQFEEAEKNIRKAMKEFETVGNQVRVENARYVLVDILLHQNQSDEAERLIHRIDGPKAKRLDKYKARLYASRGQYEKAAQVAFQMWQKNRDENALRDADSTQRMLMEFAMTRQEMERLELEEKEGLQLLRFEQERKQQQLKIWMLISMALIAGSLIFDFVRVRRKTSELFHMHRRLREQYLSRFLPPALAHAVAEGQTEFDEKPREAQVTILFASFDGFKPGTQSLAGPQEVELLNDLVATMSQAVHKNGGTLDKSGGGRIMALFGAPLALEPAASAQQALHCLRDMHAGLQYLNEKWQSRLQKPLFLRSAVHHGRVIIGSFGCSKRTDFTALGLPVQVADALEAGARTGQCLLSETVTPYTKGFVTRDLGVQSVKGLPRPIRIAELVLDTSTLKANAS
ncbi:MAG TPA: adenylate/guanylate cyclase domain-containing protein [Oligoflexus sp.]|uniref:adenylate/guanylate cyclase domain-containing protein n=1 Tax=Oligoflexus sp. TaxID=1971216 RepID=UPI002D5E0DAF|nr:adenylate/guanylate cyclase domain-containing protein [Oligoflexus sp.]HYX37870.1 adenylate/guanylate cyclase domain-containing protein [Oligoflexus sp.]